MKEGAEKMAEVADVDFDALLVEVLVDGRDGYQLDRTRLTCKVRTSQVSAVVTANRVFFHQNASSLRLSSQKTAESSKNALISRQ